jgi:hypothetical protein
MAWCREPRPAQAASPADPLIANRSINRRIIRIPIDDPIAARNPHSLAGTTAGRRTMTGPISAAFAEFSSAQVLGLWITAMGIGLTALISLAAIWAAAWTNVNKVRLEHALKQQMVERGFSADEIIGILASTRAREGDAEFPCASEVVVNADGEWQTALILDRDEDRYLVHVVGTEMSDNRWVTGDSLRFPTSTQSRCGQDRDDTFPVGFSRIGNGAGAKPASVERENSEVGACERIGPGERRSESE